MANVQHKREPLHHLRTDLIDLLQLQEAKGRLWGYELWEIGIDPNFFDFAALNYSWDRGPDHAIPRLAGGHRTGPRW